MDSEQFKLLYNNSSPVELAKLAIRPDLTSEQVKKLYDDGWRSRSSIKNNIKSAKKLTSTQIDNLIKTGIAEIQCLVADRIERDNMFLTNIQIVDFIETGIPEILNLLKRKYVNNNEYKKLSSIVQFKLLQSLM